MLKKLLKLTTALTVAASTVSLTAIEIIAKDHGIVKVTKTDTKVTIGNNAVSREFLIGNNSLKTSTITNQLGNTEFEPGNGSEEFVIKTIGSSTKNEPPGTLTSVRPADSTKTLQPAASSAHLVASADGAYKEANETTYIDSAIDSDPSTYWQSASADLKNAYYQLDFAQKHTFNQIRYVPRYDANAQYNCTGAIKVLQIEAKKDDGNYETVAVIGNTENPKVLNGTYTLDTAVTSDSVRFTALSSYFWKDGGNQYMNIAELDVMDAAGNSFVHPVTPKVSLEASSNDASERSDIKNAIDQDRTTFWVSTAEKPLSEQYFQINFDRNVVVQTVDYTPRWYDGPANYYNCTGRILGYEIQVLDGETWKTAASGSFTDGQNEKPAAVVFENSAVTSAVRIKATSSYHWEDININKYMNIGDIDVFDPDGNSLIHPSSDTPVTPEPSESQWKVTGNSVSTNGGDGGGYEALIDGNINTYYHSNYNENGTGTTGLPVDLILDRGETASSLPFQTFGYHPRNHTSINANGNFKGIELYVSDDQNKLFEKGNLKKTVNLTYDTVDWVYTSFSEPQRGRYVGIRVNSDITGSNHAAGAEIDLFAEAYDSYDIVDGAEIRASQLTLQEVSVTDTQAVINKTDKTGKMITFSFAPYDYGNGTMTVEQKVVMYDGDHFMRKYLEIENSKPEVRIDYIDGEHLVTGENDLTWTIPTDKGGVVAMSVAKSILGQPVYINGLFMGSEFPETDTQIVDGLGRMRYYTGKNFNDFRRDGQLNAQGRYVSWQTVVGASRNDGSDNSVIQSDFYDYINSIATPTEFRIQYNSWFDNMMRINDENILSSFQAVDQHLSETGVRPLESYVVDDGWNIYRKNSGSLTSAIDNERNGVGDVNTEGFWQFNSKFPNGLTPSSELVQNFGSNFGVWIGPRGGYNYYGMLADIMTESGKGSKAGGSIDVADDTYVKNFQEMAIQWMRDYRVNYWKWDGFADSGQYNAFPSGEGVVGYSETNRHMYGGVNGYYHSTDLWEKWIVLMENVRDEADALGIADLWISLTCYVNPSQWFLQWANSVWMQCTADRGERSNGVLTDKMNTMLTYRDGAYYDFIINHQFQFPLSNIYNHDPIYGKEDTGITASSMNGEEFRNYLFMQGTRGTAFWELYYSDSIFDEEKYLVNADFLEWAEDNYDLLRNAKMIGGTPSSTATLASGTSGNAGNQEAYGFSCFNGNEGIISMRNPAAVEKTLTFTLNEAAGVTVDGTYYMTPDHTYKSSVSGKTSYRKGETINVTLQPGETQIWHFSQSADTDAAVIENIYAQGEADHVRVHTSEHVNGTPEVTVTVNGKKVSAQITKSYADQRSFDITLSEKMNSGDTVEVTMTKATDAAGNQMNSSASTRYYKDNLIAETASVNGSTEIAGADASVTGKNGFAVSAAVATDDRNTVLISQGDSYSLSIDENGHPVFTLNGQRAVGTSTVSSAYPSVITGVKENNGIIKIYVNGNVEGSAYAEANRTFDIPSAAVTADAGNGTLSDVRIFNRGLAYDEVPATALDELIRNISSEKNTFTAESWNAADMDTLLAEAQAAVDSNDPDAMATAYQKLQEGYNSLVYAMKGNLALNKEVTAGWTDGNTGVSAINSGRPLSVAVDGTYGDTNSYAIFGNENERPKQPAYMQVDLGKDCDVTSIQLYRYWADHRTYADTAVTIASKEDFSDEKVLYYSAVDPDTDKFGLNVKPAQELYEETAEGKTVYDGETVTGRYIRVYGCGVHSSNGGENHIVELIVEGSVHDYDPYGLDEINEMITAAEKELAVADRYTEQSVAVLNQAVTQAKALIEKAADESLTIGEVNSVKTALSDALNGLDKKPVAPENPPVAPENPPVAPENPEDNQIKVSEVEKLPSDSESIKEVVMSISDPSVLKDIKTYESDAVKNAVTQALARGKEVTVSVRMGKLTSATSNQNQMDDMNAIRLYAKNQKVEIAQFMNVEVIVSIDGVYAGNITELNQPATITFRIPKSMQKDGRTFSIIRIHEGRTETLPITESEGVYSFTSDQFSTYALAYTDRSVSQNTPTDTSDPTDSAFMAGVMLMAVITAAGIIFFRRKNS